MLREPETRERFRPYRLQPGRPEEQAREGERERGEKEPDPPIEEAVQRTSTSAEAA